MTFNFTYDEGQAQDFSPVPAGAYECFIVATKVDKSTQKGTDYIGMKLKIRDDVNQPHQGRTFFHELYFTEKTQGMVHGFLKSIAAEQGKSFSSLQDMANYFKGRSINVTVKVNKYTNADGEERENNKVTSHRLSKVGGVTTDVEQSANTNGDTSPFSGSSNDNNYTRVDDDPFANKGGTIDISDDDLPF